MYVELTLIKSCQKIQYTEPKERKESSCILQNKGTSCQINFLLNRLITLSDVPHYIFQIKPRRKKKKNEQG